MTLGIRSRACNTACLVAGLVLLAGCNYESGERALERGDEARAAAIWEPLAARGDMRAALALARLDTGADDTPAELDEAERELGRVLRFGEDWQKGWAYYELARVERQRGRPAEAVAHYEEALEGGVEWAAYDLGQLLAEGRGVPPDPASALRLTGQAADQGLAPAVTAMGAFYARGVGVAADPEAALGWYEKAAAAGDVWGQLVLAQLLRAGDASGRVPDPAGAAAALEAAVAADIVPAKRPLGDLRLPLDPATAEVVPAYPDRALALYTEAAAAGDAWASYRLAQIYAAGRLGRVDLERAAGHYADAAEGGIGPAARALGRLYETGEGVPADPARAADLYSTAAAEGDIDAVLGLTRLARLPEPPPIDTARLLRQLEAAADENPAIAPLLGELYRVGDLVPVDPERAARYLEQALAAGDTSVRTRLASLYLDPERPLGPGRDAAFELARLLEAPPDADPSRARDLYTAAAEAGVNAAKKALADQLSSGSGGPADPARAADWYRAAAEGGDPWAAFELARLQEAGTGIPADPAAARSRYRQAAEQGIVPAQQALAAMLRDGRGGAADPAEAARWYRAAADSGEPWAAYELARLYAADTAGRLPADRSHTEIATTLYRSAARDGIPPAQLALADLLAEPNHP